jgi:hypothetical protein
MSSDRKTAFADAEKGTAQTIIKTASIKDKVFFIK